MTDTTERVRDQKALEDRLSALEFIISEGQDGKFTVVSTCEPLFCFERRTLPELADAVSNTLSSYIKTFYAFSDIKVITKIEELEVAPLPVEEFKPISRIRPSFSNLFGKERVLGYA